MGKLIVFSLAGLLLHVVHSNGQCGAGPEACHEEIVTETLLSQTRFPPENFLNAYCGIFTETVNCLVKDAEECPTSVGRNVLNEYKEIKRVLDGMCTEGSSIRTAYLANVACYNRHLENYKNCSESIKKEVDGFRDSGYSSRHPDLVLPFKYQCLKVYMEPNCKIRETAQSCSLAAAAPMRDILYAITNLFIKTLCDEEHMAIWLDEFVSYLMESKQENAVTEQCITVTETQPAVRIEATIPTGIPGTPGPNIRDSVLSIIRAGKMKVPYVSRKGTTTPP